MVKAHERSSWPSDPFWPPDPSASTPADHEASAPDDARTDDPEAWSVELVPRLRKLLSRLAGSARSCAASTASIIEVWSSKLSILLAPYLHILCHLAEHQSLRRVYRPQLARRRHTHVRRPLHGLRHPLDGPGAGLGGGGWRSGVGWRRQARSKAQNLSRAGKNTK
jgi:hypothetical protein